MYYHLLRFLCKSIILVLTVLIFTVLGYNILSQCMAQQATETETITHSVKKADEFQAQSVKLHSGRILVAPHADSVIQTPRPWMILKGTPGTIRVNGVEKKWNPRFIGDVCVADLRLDVGLVKVEISQENGPADVINFSVGMNDIEHAGPPEWKMYRMHNMKPGPNPCMWCHEYKKEDATVAIGELNPPEKACFKCHERPLITKQHKNTVITENWLEICSSCHFLHASPYKFLLRKPRSEYLKPGVLEAEIAENAKKINENKK